MGARLLSWFDADGGEWPLNGETAYLALIGAQNLYAPPFDLVTEDTPQQPGTRVKYVQIKATAPHIPLHIFADTEADLDTARRALIDAMDPDRGPGTLRHTANDGAVRLLTCYLAGGLEGDEGDETRGPGWLVAPLDFLAEDPFWVDEFDTIKTLGIGAAVGFFDQPFFPIKLSPSSIAGGFSIDNDGNAPAWPIWVISGPMSEATLTNTTTGDVLHLTGTLTAGQTITVDTRPLEKTIVREDGSPHFEYLDPLTSLWPLARGLNSIEITLADSGADSQVQLRYRRRFKGV